MATLPSLNLIGPGRLGRTLARLWSDAGLIAVGGVLGRSAQHVETACTFIGDGFPATWDDLPQAPLTLLATPDDTLAASVAALLETPTLQAGDVVFHCSGALPSGILAPLQARGVTIASVHPLKSFATPAQAINDFAGTWCGCEGDAAALAVLQPLFEAIGAHCFAIHTDAKSLYHAAAVLACNTLVALMEAALRSMEGAGVPRAAAWPALLPLIEGTVSNIGRLGTTAALTGPVARGDLATVRRQVEATQNLSPLVGDIYRDLSRLATELAAPGLSPETAQALLSLLRPPPNAAEADKLPPS